MARIQGAESPRIGIQLSDNFKPGDETAVMDLQIAKTGRFFSPRYKWFNITEKNLSEMIQNFKDGVRGVEPALDYSHESEGPAAGWFKDLYLKDGENGEKQLWAKTNLTPRGQKTLADREFGYISPDYDDNYKCNETGKTFGTVLLGAGLTNRPVLKHMQSTTQLSEGDSTMTVEEQLKQLQEQMKKLMEAAGAQDPEALMQLIADMKAKGGSTEETEKQLSETRKKLSESESKNKDLEAKLGKSAKDAEFNKLLSEGKAVEAQREAYNAGDMAKYAELATNVKLSEQGHGGGSGGDDKDVEAEILDQAKKLSEEKKIPMQSAISEVLKSNKTLSEKRDKKFQ